MKSSWPSALSVLLLSFALAPLRGDEQSPGDEAVLKAAGLTSDGPALVRFFEQRTLTEADQARLAAEARGLGADSFRGRGRAMREVGGRPTRCGTGTGPGGSGAPPGAAPSPSCARRSTTPTRKSLGARSG